MQFVMYTGKLQSINIHIFIALLTYDIYISKHAFPITILQNIMCEMFQLLGDFQLDLKSPLLRGGRDGRGTEGKGGNKKGRGGRERTRAERVGRDCRSFLKS